jgi:hypothetical protein
MNPEKSEALIPKELKSELPGIEEIEASLAWNVES